MVAATVYSDGAGNKYLGDCKWHNPDITFPLDYYLDTITFTGGFTPPSRVFDFEDSLTALFTAIGSTVYAFDPWVDGVNTTGLYVELPSYLRLRLDETATTRGQSQFVELGGAGDTGATWTDIVDDTRGLSLIASGSVIVHHNVVMSASANHVAYLSCLYNKETNLYSSLFRYGGKLQNINTNFSYYNYNNLTTGVVGGFTQTTPTSDFPSLNNFWHHTNFGYGTNNQAVLKQDDAIYPFVCADAQVPTADWATDFYVFDNNVDLGTPCMGKLPGLLIAQGTYTPFKPVKITSAATADSGSPWFLPIGTFGTVAERTVLMRVHSSMV